MSGPKDTSALANGEGPYPHWTADPAPAVTPHAETVRADIELVGQWKAVPPQDRSFAMSKALSLHAHVAALTAQLEAPIKMILFCPSCGEQHVDEPDEHTPNWTNPPHRSHLCHGCGHIWRPADVATEGVRAISTVGKADSPPAVSLKDRLARETERADAAVAEAKALREAVKSADALLGRILKHGEIAVLDVGSPFSTYGGKKPPSKEMWAVPRHMHAEIEELRATLAQPAADGGDNG